MYHIILHVKIYCTNISRFKNIYLFYLCYLSRHKTLNWVERNKNKDTKEICLQLSHGLTSHVTCDMQSNTYSSHYKLKCDMTTVTIIREGLYGPRIAHTIGMDEGKCLRDTRRAH